MSYDQIMAQLANLMKTGSKTNAYAPLIWLCGVVMVAGMGGMFYFSNPIIQYVFLGLIVIVVIFAIVMYVVLLAMDPKLLQSEHYRIEDKKLDIIASKGKPIEFNPVDLSVPTKEIGENKNG
ncbi:hypothetical protein [Mucilaginibacter ginkgonis]|uniref:Uncharacterized protein n=1 Tax=Mucilaginibacter ginkgonis TaxID=2682091 RepID=A0A6I4I059_9SPHI|nr:hypothetical protein [Mucilaginibacter ginkgonis]QQL48297.1 hypothetical protein GO620_008815 [Mucilaginibacter ginkgonis]